MTGFHDSQARQGQLRCVTPQDQLVDDPECAQVFESARLAARTAHEIASPPLVSALGYLASLSDDSLLPVELRYRAKQAALRVAEVAVQLECLPEAFNPMTSSPSLPGQVPYTLGEIGVWLERSVGQPSQAYRRRQTARKTSPGRPL
jgi:hypothetical protein